jgi:hypothetical protein
VPQEVSEKHEVTERKCPCCAEAIKVEAVVCRFCGRDLPKYEPPPIKKYSAKRRIWLMRGCHSAPCVVFF